MSSFGVPDGEALTRAFSEMGGEEYLIQKMAAGGHEVIVGGRRDPEFGHILLFGLGGVFVELFKETAIRLAPVEEATAKDMADSIRGGVILKGFRGGPAADLPALTGCPCEGVEAPA